MDIIPEMQAITTRKIDYKLDYIKYKYKLDYIKIKKFYKEHYQEWKATHGMEKIFTCHMSDKRLIFRR